MLEFSNNKGEKENELAGNRSPEPDAVVNHRRTRRRHLFSVYLRRILVSAFKFLISDPLTTTHIAPPLTPAATFPASDHSYPHPPPVRNSAELAQRYAEQPVQFPLTSSAHCSGRSIRPTRRRDDSVQQQSTRTFGRDNDPLISESPTGNLLRQFPRKSAFELYSKNFNETKCIKQEILKRRLLLAFSARRDGNNGVFGQ